MKKTTKKVLGLASGAVLLVGVSVMGTMAYLTDNESVTNEFTVGKIDIVLDEEDVDSSNTNATGCETGRDRGNSYKLIPGGTYDKDPTIHVKAGSEACYLFVKVENALKDLEIDSDTATTGNENIEEQMSALGWKLVSDKTNIYYLAKSASDSTIKEVESSTSEQDFVVFNNFTIDTDVEGADLNALTASDKIVVTAYAIQSAGFGTDPATIWSTSGLN